MNASGALAQEPLIAPATEPVVSGEIEEAAPAPEPIVTEAPVDISEDAPPQPAPVITPEAEAAASAPAPDEAQLQAPAEAAADAASDAAVAASDAADAAQGAAAAASDAATAAQAAADATATAPATDVSVVPALPATENPDENLFFDAESLVPTGEMGVKGGPSNVNPRLQPGSKFIVVKKDASPNSREAQIVSAERAIKLGRYDAALEIYNRMYEKNKRDPNVLLGRATALQHLGQDEAAIQAYEDLLTVKPDNTEAQINMLGLMGKKYPSVALRRLLDLREKSPESAGVAAQIAVVQAEMGKYNEALQYLGVAAGMEPQNASHVFNMAVIADRAGAKKEALQYYERALELDTIYGGGHSVPRESIYVRLAQLRL